MSEPGKTRLVRYDPERHGDGPWQVVGTVFAAYGFEIGEYDEDVARPHEFYVEPAGAFMVAETDDGRVVGCVGITDEGEGEFRLNRLYTLPEARRVGLGTRLVQWVIDEARKRGAGKLVLFSDVAFEDAHRLYERMGFRRNRFRYAPDHWQSREWGFEMMLGEGA
ncbi:MAG: GNAT family N-acetyltransferase [Dehalococcoidia bacterium]